MKKRKRTNWASCLRFGLGVVLVSGVLLLAGCGGNVTYAPDSVAKILSVVLTCPSEMGELRGTNSEEQVWRDHIGEYFAEDAFARFYESEDRTRFLDWAAKADVALSLQDIKVESFNGTSQTLLTAVDVIGEEQSVERVVLRWEVEYSEDSERVVSLKCVDTGGLFLK